MVYLEPVHLGWEPLITTWEEEMVEEIPEDNLKLIVGIVREVCTKLLPFIRKELKEVVSSVDNNLIAATLKLLKTFLGREGNGVDLIKNKLTNKQILAYVSFSLIWSLGANLHDKSRTKFGDSLRSLI
jgi:dynein heavy chain